MPQPRPTFRVRRLERNGHDTLTFSELSGWIGFLGPLTPERRGAQRPRALRPPSSIRHPAQRVPLSRAAHADRVVTGEALRAATLSDRRCAMSGLGQRLPFHREKKRVRFFTKQPFLRGLETVHVG